MRRAIGVAALLLALAAAGAQAQTKKELVAKILSAQQANIEALANGLAQQSVAPMISQIGPALAARVSADKRQAVSEDMKNDVRAYVEEASAVLRERAVKLAPGTVGQQLEDKFTDDELKQLLAIIESPVNRKYEQMGGEIQKTLIDKLVAESRAQIDPKLKALDESLVKRLNAASAAPAGASAPAAAKAAASAPARAAAPASAAASSPGKKP